MKETKIVYKISKNVVYVDTRAKIKKWIILKTIFQVLKCFVELEQ